MPLASDCSSLLQVVIDLPQQLPGQPPVSTGAWSVLLQEPPVQPPQYSGLSLCIDGTSVKRSRRATLPFAAAAPTEVRSLQRKELIAQSAVVHACGALSGTPSVTGAGAAHGQTAKFGKRSIFSSHLEFPAILSFLDLYLVKCHCWFAKLHRWFAKLRQCANAHPRIVNYVMAVSYTHLTLPTTPYV